jgi:hypothetical protein
LEVIKNVKGPISPERFAIYIPQKITTFPSSWKVEGILKGQSPERFIFNTFLPPQLENGRNI